MALKLTKENSLIPSACRRVEDEIARLTQMRDGIDESIKELEEVLESLRQISSVTLYQK